ncbi:sulfuric ester hydrolase [Aureococcus anophagefferens]|nr:sulfuric ester hydrolase [Aureococcus anophagefferens]
MSAMLARTLLLLLAAAARSKSSKKHRDKPTKKLNVLWLLVDDFRPQTNFYGQGDTSTPRLDAFAATARVFDRAYCQLSVCAPSRNSFFTGRRPDSLGV